LTSPKPSSKHGSESIGIPFSVGDSGVMGILLPIAVRNSESGCFAVIENGFSLKVAETVKQRRGLLKLSFRNADQNQRPH
jgi:hypothetical protein